MIPIHVKSDHSLRLAGLPALGLTDLENLAARVRFHHACHTRNVKPLTGMEPLPAAHPGRGRALSPEVLLLSTGRGLSFPSNSVSGS